MPSVVRCPKCRQTIRIPEGAEERAVRCPKCHQPLKLAPSRPVASAATASVQPTRPSASTLVDAPPASHCPACKAAVLPGARSCLECGSLLRAEPAAADGAPRPPTGSVLLGRYRVEQQLAVGGFGAVYRAVDTQQENRPVAIKDMICADPKEFDLRLTFFRREAEILRGLAAVAIVPRVYDFVEQGQSAYLVLEFIQGRDLLQVLDANDHRPFALERVIEWGQAICDVLTHMHNQSPPLVHRDLKPDNIMLLDDARQIKLIDFGTARDIGRTRKSQLAAMTRVYTQGYAPPEQIVGRPEPRSDLFALAGTLYHLATGKPPEGFSTARELAKQLADPHNFVPTAERWFYELLQINLAEDASDRYFSAKEFKADLAQRRLTREMQCPACQVINPVRTPYCTRCAQPLTDPTPPCGQCGKVNCMGSRWCIHCGNRLRERG